jgi:phosphoenolpyruvate carboxykinase (ATP)
MADYTGEKVLEQVRQLVDRSRHVGTNVTLYTGPELGRLAESSGQRNIYGGYNWDTRVRNRSAKYTVIAGSDAVQPTQTSPEQQETLKGMNKEFVRVFGGEHGGKTFAGHVNQLPVDYVYRVMGSGDDPLFTFNCHLLVTTKNRTNHHVPYMWGKMFHERDLVLGAEDLYILMVPDIHTGIFGRFYGFPESNVTVGIGCDYMGEAKKGMLRMAMYQAKRRGYLGIHAGTKIVRAQNARTGGFTRYGVAILGNSGTGKTTNVGHTHFLDLPGEQSLVVQDDFVGLRLADGRVLGTEQGLFLKTDLDADDVLLRPAVESPAFVSQNLYIDHLGEILYLDEDLCANGRGILPIKALPRDRRHTSIDLPPLEELDAMMIIFNTRRNTVCPILQELTPEQSAAYFMLGESIETAAGDPAKAGQSVREVGTNPFIVGDAAEEGNIFYEYLKRYEGKVRSFLLNTGGVGELPNPENPLSPKRAANRPWKNGIGYVMRALFRDSGEWSDDLDYGTRVLNSGVTDEHGKIYDMKRFDPQRHYGAAEREELVKKLNRERIDYLERFPKLDARIRQAILDTHRL